MALNPRQQRFVAEYLIDLNATQAAIRAGYSAKTAHVNGPRLLGNASVAAAIERGKQKAANKLQITRERVLTELARIAFSDLRRVVEFGPGGVTLREASVLSADDAAAIESVSQTVTLAGGSIKVKLHSKVEALKKLGDHLGLWAQERTPLDQLLDALPPELSDAIRRALAGRVPTGPGRNGGPAGE